MGQITATRNLVATKVVRRAGQWVNWTLHRLGYLWPWPWIFKGKLYLRNGRSDCHGTKWTGVDSMTWCETLRKWVIWMLRWLGYLWPWIVKVKLYLGNGRPECHGTKGRGMPWCETLRKRVNRTPRWLGYFWDGSPIGCPDVKDNHYVTSRQRKLIETRVT